jgi:protein tyrosine phosphatase
LAWDLGENEKRFCKVLTPLNQKTDLSALQIEYIEVAGGLVQETFNWEDNYPNEVITKVAFDRSYPKYYVNASYIRTGQLQAKYINTEGLAAEKIIV